jgi:hypothetical protein
LALMHEPIAFLAQPLFHVPHSGHIWACFGLQVVLRQSDFLFPCPHTSSPPSAWQNLASVLSGHSPHVQYLFPYLFAVSVATRLRFFCFFCTCTTSRVSALETNGAKGV